MNKNIWLELFDKSTGKTFKKYFDTEFNKDKFKRKLKYSKKLQVVGDSSDKFLDSNEFFGG